MYVPARHRPTWLCTALGATPTLVEPQKNSTCRTVPSAGRRRGPDARGLSKVAPGTGLVSITVGRMSGGSKRGIVVAVPVASIWNAVRSAAARG